MIDKRLLDILCDPVTKSPVRPGRAQSLNFRCLVVVGRFFDDCLSRSCQNRPLDLFVVVGLFYYAGDTANESIICKVF